MDRVTSTAPGPPPDPRTLRPRLPSPVQQVEDAAFTRRGVRLLLKRDDLIHPELPGNKWRKLAPNLRAAAAAGERALLTFGGAYSNHLRATAAAGRLLGFATVGVVRGDELAGAPLNWSLARCAADGMRLHFIDRARYRRRTDPEVLAELHDRFGAFRLIPEGGSNALAAQGCTELGRELRGAADTVAVACGTGGTLAGLAAGLGPGQRALGFPVLKGGRPHFLQETVEDLQRAAFGGPRGDWRLEDRFHCGGYARRTPELDAFAAAFEDRHGLPLERIYVAKLLYGLTTLAEEGAFTPGSTVAAVITGTPERTPDASADRGP
ncbi:1-aminocyclopropane-1-carboxylate deaminase/D-cysteine desulfhydrase [Streptomyces nigrescens]|uniref:Pyridoxal-phosphate dependent enzyme n=1 Tax=Streptomyces nigrescens TaxID=1920 RepID=A0ABY7IEX5_STRNI|nr:pyridoxal-phosphate dependent enzyme [Streptomyces libani]WAT96756.1 pyridoxal-phosphate dependent enzyme [Streptomyces libani subsp. libani]